MCKINKNIILEDTTLRDGEQSPGIVFNKNKKIKIFNLLIDLGVKWIECGIPIIKGDEVKSIKTMLERKNEVNIIGWNRGILKDIKYTISLGFKHIHIGLPTSNIHLKYSVKKNKNWLINTADYLIKFCKDKNLFVSISAEDIGRTDINLLKEYTLAIEKAGADRLRLSDTIGILDYEQYGKKIKEIKKISNIDLQCHCHNDFGLAVANTISGLKAGAKYFHVCINGIGERAGMPDISQLVMILQNKYKINLNIKTKKLIPLSKKISKYTNTKIFPWSPIIGENIFKHESGIHINGLINNNKTFEPFHPKIINRKRKFIIGKHSGRSTIKYFLKKEKIKIKENILKICLKLIKKKVEKINKPINIKKLCHLYKKSKKKYYERKKM